MRRLPQKEFSSRLDEALSEYRQATAEAERLYRYKVDLITINYYGPNWLETGKVGGWDEV